MAHAVARATGPLALGVDEPAPAGMTRLVHDDGTGLALPVWPDGATPALLEEYQVTAVSVERSGEARRVLAACLTCCWTDLDADPWPGEPAPLDLVLAAYRALIGRNDDLMRNWAIGALRRLHDSAWVTLSGGVVRLGPRCATWPPESHGQLRELMRRLPPPEAPSVLPLFSPAAPPAATPSTTPATVGTEATAEGPETTAEDEEATTRSAEITAEGAEATTRSAEATAEGAETSAALDGVTAPPRDAAEAMSPATSPATQEGERGGEPVGVTVLDGGGWDDECLEAFDERRRAELVAAFLAVEHAAEPVQEARFAALRDPALRRTLGEMLARRGRALIQRRDRWTSGYDDAVAAGVGTTLGEAERAVLVLVLVHSVAIPRSEGVLGEDTWLSPFPTPAEELRRHSQLPIGELESALRSLRHAGLLTQVKAGEEAGGYVPGPQFHRLTQEARRRLQEELILAAGPNTPLAAAVRAKRAPQERHGARPATAGGENDQDGAGGLSTAGTAGGRGRGDGERGGK
ncbi:hypothetical protein [Microtetraspora sp. NBRC 13810]|uniref:hypothetical protein n=1 Tax=Microtetraspora sp. NBRC 13810 TaxID=3030990 RepID=UPI002557AD35|nr:hypothetical protein [Microtetraspora sp. NBRC 13810]